MSYSARIVDTETGEVREVEAGWHDDGYFIWDEGNYGCDCNRALFFARAAGVELDMDETPCGDSRYELDGFEDDEDN